MGSVRYSRWDGRQDPWAGLSADDLAQELAEGVLEGWSVDDAFRRLLDRGVPDRAAGLRSLRERIAQMRRAQAERSGRPDPLGDLHRRLEAIKDMERGALASDSSEEARFRELALEALPRNPAAQIAELRDYQWRSEQAGADFEQLLEDLARQVLDATFRDISGAMAGMTEEGRARIKDMLADLNELAEERQLGLGPTEEEFAAFMTKHGDFFPDHPATFDELLESLARRSMAFSRFLASLPERQRHELMDLAAGLLDDLDLAFQIDRLGGLLRSLAGSLPWDAPMELGEEPVGLSEGLEAIEAASRLEELERTLTQDYVGASLDDIDIDELRRTLGETAANDVEALRRIERTLQDAGLISRSGGRVEMTPRGVRKLGERALTKVFERLTNGQHGGHEVAEQGGFDEPTGTTRQWRFGDPLRLDLRRTLHNAVVRGGVERGVELGGSTPKVRLSPNDFEVQEAERRTSVATVLLLDMSRSMPLRGHWLPAKRMALALHTLVSTMYPEDKISIVGFSDWARVMQPNDLAQVDWEPVYGTNMEHAFLLAGRLLAKHSDGSKQVLLVTDGEPTAHLEGDEVFFQWPPVRETLERTYRQAMRLAAQDVTMNVFMLEQSPGLSGFVDKLARIVRGRVFAVSGDDLGDMVVRDYLRR